MDPLASLRRVPDLVPADDAALARARARLNARIAGRADIRRAVSRRALLAGAAAVVVGGAVAGGVLGGSRRASASGLATAAIEVTDPRLLPGQFLRVTTLHDEYARGRRSRTVLTTWVPWDRRRSWVQRTLLPDGSARLARSRYGQFDSTVDYEAISSIARTPAGFRSLVPDWVKPADPAWACDGMTWAQRLLDSGEVPADVRAEFYRYLDSLAGVYPRGTATMASGRTGQVFAADDRWRQCRWEVVVDVATGDYLGDRVWITGARPSVVGVLSETRAITTDIVGSAP